MRRVMVITGTRKGIGRYLAEYYLDKGYVVAGCSRSDSDLKHENYEHYALDVSHEPAVKKMVSQVVRNHKQIDVLINNAGIASMNHAFLTPLSVVDKLFRTNVFGAFLFCREAGKVMVRKKFGRIVNFTTVAVPLNLEGEAVYAASKSAVETLTRVLAKEFGSAGITCNALGPSPLKTDLIKNVPEDKIKKLLDQQAVRTFATFQDVSHVIDFYISEDSGMITGQTIYLCGVN